MSLSIEEWQLLSFFEQEPGLLDTNEPWLYNDACYVVQQDCLRLSFAIAPSYADVRIVLFHNEQRLYEINLLEVHDVQYSEDHLGEVLKVFIKPDDAIVLRVKPNLQILHKNK